MRAADSANRTQVVRAGRIAAVIALTFVLTAVLGALSPPAQAGLGDYRCTDTGRVYYGNPRLIRRPAVVSADRIFAEIPEYQAILREGLTDKDVRYHFLMKQASKKFAKAVRATARALRHDFVAEQGAILVVGEDVPAPPDRTQEVIERLG